VFIKWGGGDLYHEYVKYPTTAEEVSTQQGDYAKAGLHGAVGSTDATHVSCDRIPVAVINQHRGYKLATPARTYNLTCDHRHRILHTTRGHPATFNDKSLIRYDRFANQIKDGSILDDCFFELKYWKASGAIGTRKFHGAWLLVDNGYLEWSVTIPPKKDPSTFGELKFSEMLESMRKDVECTFGILKGRWRYLKTGMRIHDIEGMDNIWCTCCALHNMLLDVDGLANDWGSVEMVDANEDLGQDEMQDIPFALRRLQRRSSLTEVQFDEVPQARATTEPIDPLTVFRENDESELEQVYNVRDIEFDSFRRLLIENFEVHRAKKKIQWPTRNVAA
jgi:Plant transposon protein